MLWCSDDAEEILKLRILSYVDGDFLACHYEKNGIFSVKSACKFALHLKDHKEDVGQHSGAMPGERILWNVIWNANVPQKITSLNGVLRKQSGGAG